MGTFHNKENCATKFLTITQNCFFYQHVNNSTHARPDQNLRLIDLILTFNGQAINNFSFLSPLDISCHNVIIFQYLLECTESSKIDYNYPKAKYTAMKRNLSGID